MKRVVSSTSAAETQRPLDAFGHAQWVAPHLAEKRYPDFDVERRAKDIQHVSSQCVWMPNQCDFLVVTFKCGGQTLRF